MHNKIDQLLDLITHFRQPVYSTPHARVVDDCTVVGEVDMSNTEGVSGDRATERNGCFGYSRV